MDKEEKQKAKEEIKRLEQKLKDKKAKVYGDPMVELY